MGISEAGTSSGSVYQVFLSFRGPDTRHGFTDFLYHSLTDAGICVFRDDEELRVGEKIDGALQRAIDDSRIYIPIFSRTYASSHWCLRELRQIVDNTFKSNGNKEILPIFFDVEPDDVKLKTPLYRDAILNLEREKNLSTEQVDSWREALKEVDAIKGWEVKKYNGQGELIKLVVEEVVKKLKTKQKSVTEHLIGIDDQVVAVKNLLDVGSGGGRLIQIHGMGGIGKTTLAKVVFNELSTHFGKRYYFLEDVREKSSRPDGLVVLQKKLLSEIGNAAGTGNIDATDDGMKRIKETLRHKKVLIVLDDVDKSEQVEKLVGKGALFSGSRVLITTRNEDVLQISGPKYEILRYEMKVMSSDHAFKLFSRHAFNSDSPQEDDCGISKKIVSATGRLPLTIVVIGSMLHNEKKEIWKETLDKLSKTLPEDVYDKLKISYDALTFQEQQIFLDIACFFIGEKKTDAIYMWNDCGLSPIRGIEVLKRMSLIKIGKGNEFLMHDQLRDLGRGIVHNENPMNPEERSRLWNKDEVLDTIKTKKMKNVEAMELDLLSKQVFIESEEIGRFEKLRFLKLKGGTFVGDLMDCFPKLRWIDWSAYNLKSELTNLCLKNVVVLQFSGIASLNNTKLRSLIKETRKLKVLELSLCCHITETPDLSGCSTLERLAFRGCNGLRTIDSSIGKLKHLIELTIDGYCLPDLPEEIGDLQNLECFILKGCSKSKELPDSIVKWKSLRVLELSRFESVAEDFRCQPIANLKVQLLSEIGLLSQLQRLVIRDLYEIRELPALPISLTHLKVFSISLQVVPDLSNLTNLVELDLRGSTEYDKRDIIHTGELRWIKKLSKLEELRLCLPHVPAPIELASLHRLSRLYLSRLNLQPLTQVPSSLLELRLWKFNSIALLSSNLKNLSNLNLRRPQVEKIILDGLQLPNLRELYVDDDGGPVQTFILSGMKMLEWVAMWNCLKLDEIHIAGVLESLEFLHINGCKSFRRFMYVETHGKSSHESSLILESRVFNKLQDLRLQNNHEILGIQFVGMLESLEYLELSGDHLQSLDGLSNLKNLKSLIINPCPELRIVEGLDKLKFLNELIVCNCPSLESLIDVSTTELPNDCHLGITRCPKILGVKQVFGGCVQNFKRYKEEESVWGKREERLAPYEKDLEEEEEEYESEEEEEEEEEEEDESEEEDGPLVLLKKVELPQQHITVEGGRGDVEGCSVQFQGQGGGDREEEDGGLRLHPLPPGSDQGRDQTLGHYSQAKRQRR